MACRQPATHGPRTITSQPSTRSRKESRNPGFSDASRDPRAGPLPTYQTLADIDAQLGIGRPTVKTHVENIYRKLGATTRADTAELAETAGLLPRG